MKKRDPGTGIHVNSDDEVVAAGATTKNSVLGLELLGSAT